MARRSSARRDPDCVPGHVGLKLKNESLWRLGYLALPSAFSTARSLTLIPRLSATAARKRCWRISRPSRPASFPSASPCPAASGGQSHGGSAPQRCRGRQTTRAAKDSRGCSGSQAGVNRCASTRQHRPLHITVTAPFSVATELDLPHRRPATVLSSGPARLPPRQGIDRTRQSLYREVGSANPQQPTTKYWELNPTVPLVTICKSVVRNSQHPLQYQ